MKKLSFLTSMVALTFAVPAMAVPSNASSTFPANGKMLEDYLYQNQANQTNLKVASGTATTTAQYDNCPAEYPNSDEGATSTDECYKSCALAPHATTMTGKDYSGASVTDTCAIASCNTGYTLTNHTVTPEFVTTIGVTEAGTASAYIDHSGTYANDTGSTSQATYGISAPDTFGVDYGSGKGRITGKALCSTQVGDNNSYTWTNPTINATMTPEFDTEGAGYCYCTIDSYTSPGGISQSVSAPWVFADGGGSASSCVSECAHACESLLQSGDANLAYRAAAFASLGAPVASCDATMYTVGLNANNSNATAGTESVIAKYDAAMPSITLPTMAGNVFAGYYDTNATTGGTQYYFMQGVSAHIWDKTTADPTLYARWTECSAGSYCPGDNTIQSCPNDYPSSVAGASANTQCYKSCSASSFANAATVTGNDYYGANTTDTCVITACNAGYSPTPDINLSEIIGDTNIDDFVFKALNGTVAGDTSIYNVTQNGEIAVKYRDNKGTIHGAFQCSSWGGNGALTGNPADAADASVAANLPDNVGGNCWCKVDGYIPNGGTMQNLNGQWVLGAVSERMRGVDGCPSACHNFCAELFFNTPEARNKAFGVTHVAPACEANIIQITWADAAQSDIDANEAGQCTYGGDIRTPKKAVHKPGKIFTGWTFNAQ